MRTTLISSVILSTLVAGVIALAGPSGSAPPKGEVEIAGPAHQGLDGTFTGTIDVRCRSGLEADGLFLSFDDSPEVAAEVLPECTGEWEQVPYTSGEGYEAGSRVVVAARLVLDEGTEVGAGRSIYIRPAAKVLLPETVRLRPSGLIRARFWVRCDEPWLNYATFAVVEQGDGWGSRVVPDLTCDGEYHARTRWLADDEGDGWERGRARLTIEVILETDDFDEGPEISATRRVRVR